ncbi:short transient receptor potential channel 4-like [Ptychodera flava]|uniref:short transient receptor potential channel 4-like n=1 Tax=Ptychodera flava TaxID=63121 RepID=UPI003969F31A
MSSKGGSRKRKAETTLEKYFLMAAEKGDVQLMEETIELQMQVDGDINLNFTNKNGKCALQLAIEHGHKAIIDLLLEHDVDMDDCLLYAIDNDFLEAVETILKDAMKKERDLDDRGYPKIVNKSVDRENEDFQNDMCPLVLAAHRNHYEIIQTLLNYGACDITLNEREFESDDMEWQTEKHTVERSLGLLNFYEAISSPAYISITELNKSSKAKRPDESIKIREDNNLIRESLEETETSFSENVTVNLEGVCDPFGRAFELSSTLKDMSEKEYEFSKEYLQLSEQCEQFAADLLGQTRDTKKELRTILAHDSKWKTEDVVSGDRPSKIIYAVEKEQKRFVAHPHCQQELITRWYGNGSLKHWRDKSTSRNILISLAIMLCFPVLSLVYFLAPYGKVKKFMRTPYVKFLMHTSSYLFFLMFLFMSTVDFSTLGIGNYIQRLVTQQMENQQRGPPFSALEKLIFVWIVAMTWREIKEVWNEGMTTYINDPWNWIDWVQLCLYWFWVGLRVWAYIEVALERNEHVVNDTIPATTHSSYTNSYILTDTRRFNEDGDIISVNDDLNMPIKDNFTIPEYEERSSQNSTALLSTGKDQNVTSSGNSMTLSGKTETHRHPPSHASQRSTIIPQEIVNRTPSHESLPLQVTPLEPLPPRRVNRPIQPKMTPPSPPGRNPPTPPGGNPPTPPVGGPPTGPGGGPPTGPPWGNPPHTTTERPTTPHTNPTTKVTTEHIETPHPTTKFTTEQVPTEVTMPGYTPLNNASLVVKGILDHVSDEHDDTRTHAEELAYNVTGFVLRNISQILQEIEFPSECEESLANVSQTIDALASEIYYWLPTPRPTLPDDLEPTDPAYDDVSYSSPRSEWDSSEPTLLADCVLACATVISVIRFLRVMVINEHVGPMQISFSKMIADVILFLMMFSVLWVAFALGMTQIYWSYAADEEITCLKEGGSQSDCSKQPYGTLLNSMATLFWSLFSLVDLDTLEVEPDHSSTEFFGELLFALFQLTAVIILLNLLIAFMGSTYEAVSDNADVEWKFYRSQMWMAYFRRGATLPAPFNVIPSPKTIAKFFRSVYYNIICRKQGAERKNKHKAIINAKHEDYMRVCRALVQRYFTASRTTREDQSVSPGDLMVVKQDISTFRFETYGMMQKLEGAIRRSYEETERVYEHVQMLERAVMASKLEDNELMKALQQQLLQSTDQSKEKFLGLERQFSETQGRLLRSQAGATRSSMGSNLFRQLGKELGERVMKNKHENSIPIQQSLPQIKEDGTSKKMVEIAVQTDERGIAQPSPVTSENEKIKDGYQGNGEVGVINHGFEHDHGDEVEIKSQAEMITHAIEVNVDTKRPQNEEDVGDSSQSERDAGADATMHQQGTLPRQPSLETRLLSPTYARSERPESRRVKKIIEAIDLVKDPAAIVQGEDKDRDTRESIFDAKGGLRISGGEY